VCAVCFVCVCVLFVVGVCVCVLWGGKDTNAVARLFMVLQLNKPIKI